MRSSSVTLPVISVLAGTALVSAIALADNSNRDDAHDGAYDAPVCHELAFVTHVEVDVAEQDVFIEPKPGSGQVFRPGPAERDMTAPLYAAAEPQHHAPFDPKANGPFPKGAALDISLGDWLQAEGGGTYTCENGLGHIQLHFTGLVPDGVYTIWHYFMATPPTEPFIGTYDLPLGSRDGAQSIFVADAEGNAVYDRTFTPCLQLSGEHLAAGLALNWHSDGQTYGVLPGDFAKNAHIQLFADLPPRAGL